MTRNNERTKQTILVVDDEPDLRDALIYEFENHGINTLSAGHGIEALAILETANVDLILSDIRMPRCSGIELLDQIRRQRGAYPPLILMSGFADLKMWDAYAQGADGFFGKPFLPELLLEQVDRLLAPRDKVWTTKPQTVDSEIDFDVAEGPHPNGADGFSLGRGGMFLGFFQRGLRRDSIVAFNVRFPTDSLSVKGVGVVRWLRDRETDGLPAGCGIEFLYLEPNVRARLVAYLDRIPPIAFIPKGPASRGA